MKLHKIKQGTREWLWERRGMVSPSKFHIIAKGSNAAKNSLMDLLDKNEKLEYFDDLKLAPQTQAMKHGITNEETAILDFAFRTKFIDKYSVEDLFQFWVDQERKVSCSPDYYNIEQGVGLEIKSPTSDEVHENHKKGIIADEYFWQVIGYLYLLDADYWYFMSHKNLNDFAIFTYDKKSHERFIYELSHKLAIFCEKRKNKERYEQSVRELILFKEEGLCK